MKKTWIILGSMLMITLFVIPVSAGIGYYSWPTRYILTEEIIDPIIHYDGARLLPHGCIYFNILIKGRMNHHNIMMFPPIGPWFGHHCVNSGSEIHLFMRIFIDKERFFYPNGNGGFCLNGIAFGVELIEKEGN